MEDTLRYKPADLFCESEMERKKRDGGNKVGVRDEVKSGFAASNCEFWRQIGDANQTSNSLQGTGTRQVSDMRALIARTDESKQGSKRNSVSFIMLYRNDDNCTVSVLSIADARFDSPPRIGFW